VYLVDAVKAEALQDMNKDSAAADLMDTYA